MFPYDTLALGFAAAVDAALISEETVDALLREMGIDGTPLSSWGWHKVSLEVGIARPSSVLQSWELWGTQGGQQQKQLTDFSRIPLSRERRDL